MFTFIEVAKENVVRQYIDFLTKFGSDLDGVDHSYQSMSKDKPFHLLGLDAIPHEEVELVDLINSDNEALRKVILALSHLIQEIDFLNKEGKSFYHSLLYYGEGVEDSQMQQGECHTCAGKMVPMLQKLLHYVIHCYNVISNTVQQLSQLYCAENSPKYLEVGETHFKIIFERLGNLLGNLVTLDTVINRNKQLREHIAQFQHVVRSIQHDPTAFETVNEDLVATDRLLDDICEKVLSGTIFLRCVSQNFGSNVSTNAVFLAEVAANVKGFLQDISSRLSKEEDRLNLEICRKFLSSVCLHILHAHMGMHVDKKQLKTIIDQSRLIVAVPLVGSCLWFPDQFLPVYLPKGQQVFDQKTAESIATSRFAFLRQKSLQLVKDVSVWNTQVVRWISRLSAQTGNSQEELARQCSLILQGQRFVSEMSVMGKKNCALILIIFFYLKSNFTLLII